MVLVGIAKPLWRGKHSWHSRRKRNPQFYVSSKLPLESVSWNYIRTSGDNTSIKTLQSLFHPEMMCCKLFFFVKLYPHTMRWGKLLSKLLSVWGVGVIQWIPVVDGFVSVFMNGWATDFSISICFVDYIAKYLCLNATWWFAINSIFMINSYELAYSVISDRVMFFLPGVQPLSIKNKYSSLWTCHLTQLHGNNPFQD